MDWLVSIGTVAAVLAGVVLSWHCAARDEGGQKPRLRWYIVAKTPASAGTRIGAAHLERTFGRLPEDSSFVPAPDRVLNTYTGLGLLPGDRVIPECVFTAAPVFPDDRHVVVPVHLKREDAVALQPGMRVAFARDSHYLPPPASADSGFTLLALDRPASGTTATALAAVSRTDAASLRRLVTGDWRAITLHAPPQSGTVLPGRLPLPCIGLLARDFAAGVASDSAAFTRTCAKAKKQDALRAARDTAWARRNRTNT
jgi:hypothetical protein